MLAKTYLKPTYLPTYSDSGDSIDGIDSSDISDSSDQQKRFIKKITKKLFSPETWFTQKTQNVTKVKISKCDNNQKLET